MTTASTGGSGDPFTANVIETLVKILALAFLMIWCLQIMYPFVVPMVWGIVIAVAIYPLYLKLRGAMGGKDGLAAAVLALFGLALLLLPTWSLGGSLVDSVKHLSAGLEKGTLTIPPPPDSVVGWPLIGESLSNSWSLASTNLEEALEKFEPQVKAAAAWLAGALGGVAAGVLQFVISIIIAGALLANAEGGKRVSCAIASRLVGDHGPGFVSVSAATVRSVAQGVLGVAIIQAMLAAVGLVVVGVPGAGLWALLVLLLAVMQLPPFLILLPIMIYVFSVESTTVATIFAVWSIFVSISDSFLKPMLLGRGVDVPMFVILIGAIGGMLVSGIVGLFVGAVILSLGYKLFLAWLGELPQEVA